MKTVKSALALQTALLTLCALCASGVNAATSTLSSVGDYTWDSAPWDTTPGATDAFKILAGANVTYAAPAVLLARTATTTDELYGRLNVTSGTLSSTAASHLNLYGGAVLNISGTGNVNLGSGTLRFGYDATGVQATINITDGGKLATTGTVCIGYTSSSNALLSIDNGTFSHGVLYLGGYGANANRPNVSGVISARNAILTGTGTAYIGSSNASAGIARLYDSTWTVSGNVIIGNNINSCNGTLALDNSTFTANTAATTLFLGNGTDSISNLNAANGSVVNALTLRAGLAAGAVASINITDSTLNVTTLHIGNAANATATLNLTNSTSNATSLHIANAANATGSAHFKNVTLTGLTNTVYFGNANATATFSFDGGTFGFAAANTSSFLIANGKNANATLDILNGSFTCNGINSSIGRGDNSNSTITIHNGTVSLGRNVRVAGSYDASNNYSGNAALATVNVNGGCLTAAGWITIGQGNDSTGTVNVNGTGTRFEIGDFLSIGFGANSTGTLSVNGGDVVVTNWIGIGRNGSDSTGTLNLTSGSLWAASFSIGNLASSGSGTLNQSGGLITSNTDLNIGLPGSGTLAPAKAFVHLSGDAVFQNNATVSIVARHANAVAAVTLAGNAKLNTKDLRFAGDGDVSIAFILATTADAPLLTIGDGDASLTYNSAVNARFVADLSGLTLTPADLSGTGLIELKLISMDASNTGGLQIENVAWDYSYAAPKITSVTGLWRYSANNAFREYILQIQYAPIPEPATTALLLGLGLAVFLFHHKGHKGFREGHKVSNPLNRK